MRKEYKEPDMRQMAEDDEKSGSPVLHDGQLEWQRPERKDPTDVTDSELALLKTHNGESVTDLINAGWKLSWDNAPAASEKAWGYDNLTEQKDAGSRIVMKPNGELLSRMDTVAILVPPAAIRNYERETEAAARRYAPDYNGDIESDDEATWGGPRADQQFDKSKITKAMVQNQSAQNRANGIIDGKNGMTLEEGMARLVRRHGESGAQRMVERLWSENRGPARRESLDETRAAYLDEQRGNYERRSQGGKKQYAMGATFDKQGNIVR